MKSLFDFFDIDKKGVIDFADFAALMGDEKAMSQPRWNSSPPKRYRREEERYAETKKMAEDAQKPRGWGSVQNNRPKEWADSEDFPGQNKGMPPPFNWTPISDLGTTLLENKPVQSRYLQANEDPHPNPKAKARAKAKPYLQANDGTVQGKWMSTLRANETNEVGLIIPTRDKPYVLEGPLGQSQVIGTEVPSDEWFAEEHSSERQGGNARVFNPARMRIQGQKPERNQEAHLGQYPSGPYIDEAHYLAMDQSERMVDAEAQAQELYSRVPKNVGRIKSEAELAMAKKARIAKKKAEKEFNEWRKISDLGASEHPIAYSGTDAAFAEWQRAVAPGIVHPGMPDDMPSKVKEIVAAMKKNGFSDCYFFRSIDKNRTGFVTKREFEEGLTLLKISLHKEELSTLFDYFTGESPSQTLRTKKGKISYHELQKALNSEDGTSKSKTPRFSNKQPATATAGPNQFSSPGTSPLHVDVRLYLYVDTAADLISCFSFRLL